MASRLFGAKPVSEIASIASNNGLALNRWQAIIWTNSGLVYWHKCVTGPQVVDESSKFEVYGHLDIDGLLQYCSISISNTLRYCSLALSHQYHVKKINTSVFVLYIYVPSASNDIKRDLVFMNTKFCYCFTFIVPGVNGKFWKQLQLPKFSQFQISENAFP